MKKVAGPPSEKARSEFLGLVDHWSKRLRVKPKGIHIRPMSRKWASCSTAGRLTFANSLVRKAPAFREYVVVHELLHLRLPNHGKLFTSLLSAYVPRWQALSRNAMRKPADSSRPSTSPPSTALAEH